VPGFAGAATLTYASGLRARRVKGGGEVEAPFRASFAVSEQTYFVVKANLASHRRLRRLLCLA
jgi:hypothetical protein